MKLNVHFFVLLIISIVVIISDILIYFFKLNYRMSIVIGCLISISWFIYLIKNKKIVLCHDFEKADLLFLLLIILKIIFCINRPDMQYDVSMYHIYNQVHPFMDKVNFDYFPGRTLNSFIYPLGDRIFYLSRYLLGYRFGTILSYYSIVAIFYQIKSLTYAILEKEKDKRVSLLSGLVLSIYTMYIFIGSYYIDIFSLAFDLAFTYYIFDKKELFKDKFRLYFFALIIGISAGIKISNLVFAAVIGVLLLIKNYKDIKDIKIRDILICVILFVIPFITYMIDNIKQTGSPMFPYYNTIFKSQWFDIVNLQAAPGFGLPNILYSVIWPIVVAINPLKGTEVKNFDFIWGIGYLITICYLCVLFFKKRYQKKNRQIEFLILTLILSVVWAIIFDGYMRYAYIIPVLYLVVFQIVFIELDEKDKDVKEKFLLYIVTIFIISIISISSFTHMIVEARIFNQSWSDVQLFKDIRTEKIHIDGAWMTLADDSKLVTMVREEGTPIYYLESRFLNSSLAKERQMDLKQKELYTIIDDYNKAKKIDELTLENMQIEEVIEKDKELNFLPKDDKVMVCKIKYNANNDEVRMNNLKYYN